MVRPIHSFIHSSICFFPLPRSHNAATTLSAQVGYGNVAGYLFNKGLMAPPPANPPSPETAADAPEGNINPIAPPLLPQAQTDGSIRAELTLGHEYHGPPGCVHGGVVAMIADEMLGIANAVAGIPAMTVELDVRYHSPTPLGEPLVFTSRQTRRDGRKIWTEAELRAGDRLCASATGLFVIPRRMAERMAAEEEARVTAGLVTGE